MPVRRISARKTAAQSLECRCLAWSGCCCCCSRGSRSRNRGRSRCGRACRAMAWIALCLPSRAMSLRRIATRIARVISTPCSGCNWRRVNMPRRWRASGRAARPAQRPAHAAASVPAIRAGAGEVAAGQSEADVRAGMATCVRGAFRRAGRKSAASRAEFPFGGSLPRWRGNLDVLPWTRRRGATDCRWRGPSRWCAPGRCTMPTRPSCPCSVPRWRRTMRVATPSTTTCWCARRTAR